MKTNNLKKVEKIIEDIKDTAYFKRSLTHVSFCHENNLPDSLSYENLEFLGDSIINFLTCYYLFKNFPEFNEGKMSKLEQLMVQEKTLAAISEEINLAKYVRLGTIELKSSNGSCKTSILADIFESFVSALYLTKGLRQTIRFLHLTLFDWVKGKEDIIWDYKTRLQEYCQANKNSVSYELVDSRRKNNEHLFVVRARDKLKTFTEEGEGKSRKKAEQNAAARVLEKLGVIPKEDKVEPR